jgi:hypothetical protein
MRHGSELEPVARAAYERQTGLVMQPLVVVEGEYSASLDGITLAGERILEIKCPVAPRYPSIENLGPAARVPVGGPQPSPYGAWGTGLAGVHALYLHPGGATSSSPGNQSQYEISCPHSCENSVPDEATSRCSWVFQRAVACRECGRGPASLLGCQGTRPQTLPSPRGSSIASCKLFDRLPL